MDSCPFEHDLSREAWIAKGLVWERGGPHEPHWLNEGMAAQRSGIAAHRKMQHQRAQAAQRGGNRQRGRYD